MADTHSWYTCCINPAAPAKASFTWGVAANPSYNGVTTAKVHADTFSILNTTKNPDEAFTALAALVASPELLTNYGPIPILVMDGWSWQMGHNAVAYQEIRALVKSLLEAARDFSREPITDDIAILAIRRD